MKTRTLITLGTLLALTLGVSAKPGGGKKRGEKGAKAKRALPDFIVTAYDTDGDGELSRAERGQLRSKMEERRNAMRAEFDTDGDGSLSAAEKEKLKAQKRTQALAKYDADASGSLEKEERKTMIDDLKASDPVAALALMRHHKAGKVGKAGRGGTKGEAKRKKKNPGATRL